MAISARNQTLFSLKLARHLGSILGGSLMTALALTTACYGDPIEADDDDDQADDDDDDENTGGDDDDDDDASGDDDDDSSDDDDDDDDDTSSEDTETTTEHAMVTVTIKATLLDPKGEPIKMQRAQICAEGHGCILFTADQILDDGKVEAKLDLVTGHYDFLVGSTDPERHFSQTPSLAVVEKDGELDFGEIYIPEAPELSELAASGSTALEIDDKLTLDITSEGMWDCAQVGGVAVQDEHIPPTFKEQIAGEVLGVWAFAGYGACDIKDPPKGKTVGVTIHDALGLEAGDKVDVYQVDWGNGEPLKLTSATVDDEGKTIATKDDDGLTRLTWMAIVKPE